MFGSKPLLDKKQEQRILDAIAEAERNTSGEIRVHFEKTCPTDPYKRAVQVFEKLGMTATQQRNGVLVYMAMRDHRFAIIGDQGINEKVPENFWQSTVTLMREYFAKGDIPEGIAQGILQAGIQLKRYFPYTEGDVNELKDDISYGKDI